MKLLVIGDIYGRPGRRATAQAIAELKKERKIDYVIANGENMAHGSGMTPKTFMEMRDAGVDFFTSGNHIYKKSDIFEEMDREDTLILRPANFPEGNVGHGYRVIEIGKKKLLIINLIGRVFMPFAYDCPFKSADRILKEHANQKMDGILVDFHAETTSEKIALKHYLDGRVSALWGTHTHVPTADAEVTEKGLAYITDVGMTGPKQSVIGVAPENIIESIVMQKKFVMKVAEGRCVFNAVVIELAGPSASKSIELVQREID